MVSFFTNFASVQILEDIIHYILGQREYFIEKLELTEKNEI